MDNIAIVCSEDKEVNEPMGMLELSSDPFFQCNELLFRSEPICDCFPFHVLEECLNESQSLQECPIESFQFDMQICDEFYLNNTSYILVQEFILFQLGEVSMECDIGFGQDACFDQYDSVLIDEHDQFLSHSDLYFQFVHKFQRFNNSECTYDSQYASWIRNVSVFDQQISAMSSDWP